MATKQGYLKEKGSQDKLAPKTLDSLVKDSARNRALSASLQELAESQCLGYPPFATTQNYTVGDKVFYDRKLWKFTSSHTAGAWNASHVTAWSVEDEVSELKLAVTELDERKANIDGFYEGMGVGVAKRLEGNTDVAGSFLERPTGGDVELANGLAQLNEVQGNSIKFNQLMPDHTGISSDSTCIYSDGVYTTPVTAQETTATTDTMYGIIPNEQEVYPRSYLFVRMFIKSSDPLIDNVRIIISSSKTTSSSAWSYRVSYDVNEITQEFKEVKFIIRSHNSETLRPPLAKLGVQYPDTAPVDFTYSIKEEITVVNLTKLFGAGNEPSTVAEFEAWLTENVGLKDYYDYTEGEVVNNNMTGIESTGFNLFNPTTGKARIIGAYSEVYGNYYGIRGTYGTLTFEDDLGNVSTVTPDADGKFELDVSGYLSVADAGNDVAVFLWWDGKKTEYEDYDVDTARLDVRHIYGKKNGTGDLVQVWPTGMPRINDIVDKLCIKNGAVVAKRAIGEVDMGILTWNGVLRSDETYNIRAALPSSKQRAAYTSDMIPNILTSRYRSSINTIVSTNSATVENGEITVNRGSSSRNFILYDTNYNGADSAAAFKTAMAGVLLYYELETPETYTDLVYMGSEYFADGTPVALPVNYKVDNWGVESILPKNTSTILTAKPTIKVRYAIDAVEQLNTHSDEIEDLYDGLDELDKAKANTVGVYDDMVVGAAKAIAGNQRLDKEFTSMVVEGADGVAKINEVRGKSLVWNQLVNTDTTEVTTVNGHKYLTKINGVKSIITSTGDAITINDVSTDQVFYLTKMFGAGNEPATVEEFESMFPDAYYEYNDGEIINNATEELDVTGFNQWDGTYSITNFYLKNDGGFASSDNYDITDYIDVFAGQTYYLGPVDGSVPSICWYDGNKIFISGTRYLSATSKLLTAPANARYCRFSVPKANPNVCLNLSLSGYRNGEYEPYKHGIVSLNLSTITGKQVGVEDAESVIIFPDGMRQAGSVADTLIVDDDGYARRVLVKIGSVDLGTLGWSLRDEYSYVYFSSETIVTRKEGSKNIVCDTYNTAPSRGYLYNMSVSSYNTTNAQTLAIRNDDCQTNEAMKAALDGVILYYELAEYKEYILDEPILMTFKAYHGGTIVQSPQAPDSAPMSMNVTFALDAVGTINNLPQDYISANSMDAFLAQLGTAMNGTWTKSWDATNNRYGFTFTPNT